MHSVTVITPLPIRLRQITNGFDDELSSITSVYEFTICQTTAQMERIKRHLGSRCFICSTLLIVALSAAPDTHADTVTRTTSLDFGTIAIGYGTGTRTLTISHTGSTSSTGGIYTISTGQPAEFDLTGYPPFTTLSIDIDDGILSSGGSQSFTVTDYNYNSPVVTDGSGNYTLSVGATLTTDIGITNYSDATYTDLTPILTVNY